MTEQPHQDLPEAGNHTDDEPDTMTTPEIVERLVATAIGSDDRLNAWRPRFAELAPDLTAAWKTLHRHAGRASRQATPPHHR